MPADSQDHALTLYLRDPHGAGAVLAEQAIPVVYRELRAIAAAHLHKVRRPDDLDPTALVHEAYLKLLGTGGADINDRRHFFALAARAMRQLCVDHARHNKTRKRGGDRAAVTLDEAIARAAEWNVDLLDLDAALGELAVVDAAGARLVELRFFGGLSMDDVAKAMGISLSTAEREWRAARAWLATRLSPPDPPDNGASR